ncbi:MAG: glycosyltransferase family 39 protein, partial [Nakamurella sp.]
MTDVLSEHPGGSTLLPPGVPPADADPPARVNGVGGTRRGKLGRLFLGPVDEPGWARPGLWVLLLATAVLYLWDLTASGYANDFYSAAVKSGTESWKAWLFASLDSSSAITVDKPPASLWLMVLSGRILGFSSFSLLLPQALLGVGTVATIYAAVRRWSGPAAGLVAGALLALTPVAALMFRFDNPDALLVFLMTLAGYFVVRAVETERGRTALRWLLLAGVAIGFAFLTKMLQGTLVLPGFALAYLVAGRSGLWTRIWHLLAALGAVIVSAGWFVLLVSLWPADSRPYIGGSTDNSLWELAIGYNGLSRIFGGAGNGGGARAAAGGAGGGNAGFGGSTGLFRMFGTTFGTEISWLIPAALIGLAAGLWFTRHFPRTDRIRAGLLLWGGSMIVTALVFSFMSGTIHPYYAVALAPSIAAVVAIAGTELWRGRTSVVVRSVLALMIAATGIWSFVLLGRDATWLPWLRWVVLIGSIIGAALLAASIARLRRLAVIGLLVGSLTALGGTTGYTIATAATPHSGSVPTSGPAGSATG